MKRYLKNPVLILCVAILCVASNDTKESCPYGPLPGSSKRIIGLSATSRITGITYPYHVYLPPLYENNPGMNFPVIYATDGQWCFDGYSKEIEEQGREYIFVAIEEGGPPDSERRRVDYTYPGAEAYFDFFTTEFIPLIESVYRVDKSDRTLAGMSLGGLFVVYAMFWDDPEEPLFDRYLAYDGSFWRNADVTAGIMKTRYKKNSRLDTVLVLTSARTAGNEPFVVQFESDIESRGFEGLTIKSRSFDCEHLQVGNPSLRYSLNEVFGE